MKVLIVDDEKHCADGIKYSVDWNALGICEALTAYSMKQAQEAMRGQSIDIILCDIEMPQGSGFDLLNWIKNERFETVSIVLTSYATFDYAHQALALGCIDYLLKPVEIDALMQVIRRAIDKISERNCEKASRTKALYWDEQYGNYKIHFWRDVILGTIAADNAGIEAEAEQRHLGNLVGLWYIPLLVVGNPRTEPWEVLEKQLMEALENIFVGSLDCIFVPLAHKKWCVIICTSEESEQTYQSYCQRFRDLVEVCQKSYGLFAAGYIGCFCTAAQICEQYGQLEKMNQENTSGKAGLFELRRQREEEFCRALPLDSSSVVDYIRKYIKTHLGEDLSRHSLAEKIFLSEGYLTRIFKQHTGLSIPEFVTRERMAQAKLLLEKTDKTVGDVAYEVGYENAAYFTKVFREMNHMTPAKYRKNSRKNF